MSTFTLDRSGEVLILADPGYTARQAVCWSDLSPFVQGYVEAAARELYERLASASMQNLHRARRLAVSKVAFHNWSPEALALILRDCEAFAARGRGAINFQETPEAGGRFWIARQTGFPQAGSQALCDAFPPLTPYLSDDGKVCLREDAQ